MRIAVLAVSELDRGPTYDTNVAHFENIER
jgi:hypothetical protein